MPHLSQISWSQGAHKPNGDARSGFGGRTRRGLVALTLAAMALALVGVTGVSAATPNYRPDAKIRQPCDPYLTDCRPVWVGNNIYNTTAAGQLAEHFVQQGVNHEGPMEFRIRIQNDGARADRIRVKASGSTSGFRVRFFRGTTNITTAVNAGTYTTPRLAAGATIMIKAVVTLRTDAVNRDEAVRLVTLTSVGNPRKQDAVKFVRTFGTCSC